MTESVPFIMTVEDLREYAAICGNRCAADLLMLIGPDNFAGSYDEYTTLYKELEGE